MNPLTDIRDRPADPAAWSALADYLHGAGKPATAGAVRRVLAGGAPGGAGPLAASPAPTAHSGHVAGVYVALSPHPSGYMLHVRSHHPLDPADRALGAVPVGEPEGSAILGEFSHRFPYYAPPDVAAAGHRTPDRRVPAADVARVDSPRPDLGYPRA